MPQSVLRRLTKYLAYAQMMYARGAEWVSSQEIGDALGMTSSTVRQDLTHLDFSGTSKKGYATGGLKAALDDVLGADAVWSMIVVGAGNLGSALALHEEFGRRGFLLHGIFDTDPRKIGRKFGDFQVQSLDDLPSFVGEKKVDIGIIAVPPAAAQRVADLMIASGIRGLLNLTFSHIVAPRRVSVVDARIVASLQELAHAIKSKGRGLERRAAKPA
jgi:redox-sensing transcriptional repressor